MKKGSSTGGMSFLVGGKRQRNDDSPMIGVSLSMQDRVEALHRRVGDSVSWLDSDRGVTNVLPAACIPSPPALLLVTYPEYTAPHRWLIHS